MKRTLTTVVALVLIVTAAHAARAAPARKSVLDNDPDLFAVVTPDRLLGDESRRHWLTMWPVNGREYWAAWDCKDKPCDSPQRAHERATAKLIKRLPTDPKPEDAPRVPMPKAGPA